MCNTTIVNTAARRLTGDGRPREGGEPALRDARYKTQLPPPESPSLVAQAGMRMQHP